MSSSLTGPSAEGGGAGPVRPVRGLVVMDVDATFIHEEVIELLADRAGHFDEVRAVTAAAMGGTLDFAESLRRRVARLAGVDSDVFAEVASAITVREGAAELIAHLHRRAWRIGLVSGGFHEVLDLFAPALGIDHVEANRLEIVDGRLTGRVTGPIVDAARKRDTLRRLIEAWGVDPARTMAVGDGANDALMLEAARLGVALNAKPALVARADVALEDHDLRCLIPYVDDLDRG